MLDTPTSWNVTVVPSVTGERVASSATVAPKSLPEPEASVGQLDAVMK
jgi:hypothetical protein